MFRSYADSERPRGGGWRFFVLAVFLVLAVATATYFVSASSPKTYTAVGQVFLGPAGYTVASADNVPSQRVNTIALLATSERVLASASERAGVDPVDLREQIKVTPATNADEIDIEISSYSPDEAARLVRAVEAVLAEVTTVRASKNDPRSNATEVVPGPAVKYASVTTPDEASAPLPLRDAALAATGTVALLFAYWWMRRTRPSADEGAVRDEFAPGLLPNKTSSARQQGPPSPADTDDHLRRNRTDTPRNSGERPDVVA